MCSLLDQECLERPVPPRVHQYPAVAPPSFPCRPGSSILIESRREGSLTDRKGDYGNGKKFIKRGRSRVTIYMLPDIALLEIFDFYIHEAWREVEAWHTLVHVCRKWRDITFGSPSRLNLRLYCKASTPVRDTLAVWPLLPIIITAYNLKLWGERGEDNIIAALEHNDRICQLYFFSIPSLQMEKILAAMERPFPELTYLRLGVEDKTALVVPASFLDGSAPRLQRLILEWMPFPGLPKLLLSATHLVDLTLWRIPHSGYISPEAMATCVSALTRLERLDIQFESPRSRPGRKDRRPPMTTRTLPVLTELWFSGVSEYLEDLVARIDVPLLDFLHITFFHQLIFDTPQLAQFISRTPKFKAHEEARVVFFDWQVSITFPKTFDGELELEILCRQPDWQLSSLAQVCNSSFPTTLIPEVEHLYILGDYELSQVHWQDDIESGQWLELLHPFNAVKRLYISQEFVRPIALALQEVTEVLPALEILFLEEPPPSGPVHETIGNFIAVRRLAGHPLVVSSWEREASEKSESSYDD